MISSILRDYLFSPGTLRWAPLAVSAIQFSPVKQALRGDGLHKCCDNDYRAVIIDMHYLKQL